MSTPEQWGQPPSPPPPYGQAPPPGQSPAYGQNPAPPYGQYPPPPYGQYPPPGYVPARPMNGFAIASMVLGIVWIYGIGSILALVFGYIAKGQIKEQGQAGGGMAIAGIVLGWVGIALTIVGFGLMIYFVNKVDSLFDPSLYDPELYTS
jgi:hypothetical protein